MRHKYWAIARNTIGEVAYSSLIYVSTDESGLLPVPLYSSDSSSGSLDYVETDGYGYFEFWVDENDGYDASTVFTITILGGESGEIEVGSYANISIIPPIAVEGTELKLNLILPEYADNTAAVSAGLTSGQLYMTSAGQVMIVLPESGA